MEPLEIFKVETKIPEEAEAYRSITSDVISELALANSIGRIYVIITPEESLFQMAVILRGSPPLVKTSDFADVNVGAVTRNEIQVVLRDEKHLPELLEKLWAKYSRGKVIQQDRKTINVTVENMDTEIEAIKEMIIFDPKRTLLSRLVEMAIRTTPEGFRVRYHSLRDNEFIFVASEDAMKPEWVQQGHQMLEQIKGGLNLGGSA
ncbi:putative methanogenesis marker protein 17 [Methanomethylovorans hollandica DSM 15978]|jgi:putative methanogenesis marker protein 17|uniref:Putative methanogenesis marker protein 17 n=1 Tax=Methanomethylovorans hollandica (strain DSM 15978 / NBRC 107637 / DMS1) TaxID=867904 RepID=L0KTK0_METHD|nr:methanogenesis marker 17 protein [Methanomethylovorans hollandica]AGB48446.1 putative methanogenesis marker protein 17 [Methanomethylovorans hollandica DSM 15978]